jgi:hypothetical protein
MPERPVPGRGRAVISEAICQNVGCGSSSARWRCGYDLATEVHLK